MHCRPRQLPKWAEYWRRLFPTLKVRKAGRPNRQLRPQVVQGSHTREPAVIPPDLDVMFRGWWPGGRAMADYTEAFVAFDVARFLGSESLPPRWRRLRGGARPHARNR